MSRLVVAVDPGGRHTGVVLRSGDALHYWALLTRDTDFDWYLGEVVDTVTKAKDRARTLALQDGALFDLSPVLAVEDLNDPTPQMGLTSLRGLIDTAQVIGAIAGQWPIIRVPPGRHGSHPLNAYPTPLVGARERSGKGTSRHVRAAWDIAHTAVYVAAASESVRSAL